MKTKLFSGWSWWVILLVIFVGNIAVHQIFGLSFALAYAFVGLVAIALLLYYNRKRNGQK